MPEPLSRSSAFGAVARLAAGSVLLGLAVWTSASAQLPPTDPLELDAADRLWLDTHPGIRLAAYSDYAPAQFYENGKHVGLAADYVAIIEEKLGITFEHVESPDWAEILTKAEAKELDVIPLAAVTPDRSAYLSFTTAYLELPAFIIGRASESKTLGMDDLIGKQVAVAKGYAVAEYLDDMHAGLIIDLVPDTATGLRQVASGESFAFITDLAVASYHLEKQGISNLRVMQASGYVYEMGFAVRKDWPDLTRIIDKALATIPESSRQTIFGKWISLDPPNPRRWTAWLLAGGAVVMLVAGSVLWNRALTRKVEQRTAAYRRELAERRRAQKILAGRNVVLEQITTGRPLEQILKTLIQGVEAARPGMFGSVLLLDEERKRLKATTAPSLPDFYNRAIDGLKIGPKVGCCGAAAYSGRRVIASDIMTHPNWEPFRELAKRAGLRACWSEPIVSSDAQMLGTLAMYYPDVREPGAEDLALMKNTANLAAIAIQRSQTERALRASDEKLADYMVELEDRVAERTRDLETARDQLLALNERFRSAKDVAEVASVSKSEFLANMSHEIRSPMTAILGYADIVYDEEKRSGAPPARIEAIDTIRRNGKQLLAIINDILDLSKFEAGKMTVESEDVSPVMIVGDVVGLMHVRADAKGLTLDTFYAGAIPETIQSDATRLRQILVNLVGNAIKFTERGGIRLTVRHDPAQGGEPSRMTFEVHDTGIGIDDEQMDELFQPFTQADASTTRKFGGTGLGLTISRRFAEALGGDITVSGAPGEGCTFVVQVATGAIDDVPMIEPGGSLGYGLDGEPVEAVPEVQIDPTLTEVQEDGASDDDFTLDGIRILLAEDTLDNQRLILHHLQGWGAQVEIADDGRAAVESAFQAERNGDAFDLVLMDMSMPEMDGYAATRLLRERGYARPIIALTAHAMRGDRERCLEAGTDEYISKPIDPSLLFTKIIEAVGRAMLEIDFSDNGEVTEVAPPAEIDPSRVVDAESALARAGGSPELLTELIDLFLGDTGRRLAEMRKAADDGDAKSVHEIAHSMKGSAGNLSAAAAAEAALRVEQLAKKGDVDALEPALAELDREIGRLRPALLALREG